MRSLTQTLVFVFVTLLAAIPALAQVPPQALEAYYVQMGKNAAILFNHQKTQADAQTNRFTAWVDAQCKILNAKSAWITATANANATNAKTLVTLQEVRSAVLDNNLKVTKTFYDKRALHAGYQGLNVKKRPTQEDVIRYSKISAPKRPTNFQLTAMQGTIHWPETLLDEDFFHCRARLDSLFAQRSATSPATSGNISRQIQTTVTQMRGQLRAKIRDMSPTEYLAARRFVDSLAYEAGFNRRIDGLASK